MATAANIKAALTVGDNLFDAGRKVGADEYARFKAWFESTYEEQLDGREMSADDLGSYLLNNICAPERDFSGQEEI